jgi:hypothetical protein
MHRRTPVLPLLPNRQSAPPDQLKPKPVLVRVRARGAVLESGGDCKATPLVGLPPLTATRRLTDNDIARVLDSVCHDAFLGDLLDAFAVCVDQLDLCCAGG